MLICNADLNSRVLQRFVKGELSHDNEILTAIMVRGFPTQLHLIQSSMSSVRH